MSYTWYNWKFIRKVFSGAEKFRYKNVIEKHIILIFVRNHLTTKTMIIVNSISYYYIIKLAIVENKWIWLVWSNLLISWLLYFINGTKYYIFSILFSWYFFMNILIVLKSYRGFQDWNFLLLKELGFQGTL